MADESKNSRTYHVLKQRTGGADLVGVEMTLDAIAEVEASSGEQAIRLTAAEQGAGTYVAIPDRSWTLIGVRVETPAPRVILGDAQTALASA